MGKVFLDQETCHAMNSPNFSAQSLLAHQKFAVSAIISRQKALTASLNLSSDDGGSMCPHFHDGVLCWPKTPLGGTAHNECPDEIFGVAFVTKCLCFVLVQIAKHVVSNCTQQVINHNNNTLICTERSEISYSMNY